MKKIVALVLAVILVLSLSAVSFAKYKGDINSDGLVNSSDALAVLKYAVGIDKEINKAVADMNADEKINSSDALAILQV
ncbi:MAG: dockerin type I repeat-containing protein, partial [Acutalibacteraceae bacterium]|nr:dockerin type I repeat-containing protein [Acutalibacteraceae bacterium]